MTTNGRGGGFDRRLEKLEKLGGGVRMHIAIATRENFALVNAGFVPDPIPHPLPPMPVLDEDEAWAERNPLPSTIIGDVPAAPKCAKRSGKARLRKGDIIYG
jgi:hypothetical protein